MLWSLSIMAGRHAFAGHSKHGRNGGRYVITLSCAVFRTGFPVSPIAPGSPGSPGMPGTPLLPL